MLISRVFVPDTVSFKLQLWAVNNAKSVKLNDTNTKHSTLIIILYEKLRQLS